MSYTKREMERIREEDLRDYDGEYEEYILTLYDEEYQIYKANQNQKQNDNKS